MNCVEIIFALCWKKKLAISRVEKDLSFGNGYFKSLKRKTIPSDRLEMLASYFSVSIGFLLGVGSEPYLLVTEYRLFQAEKSYEKETDDFKRIELAQQIDLLRESLSDQQLGNALSAIKKNTAAHVGDGGSSKVMEFLESQPKDVLRGILAALQAPEDVLAELDRPERKE